MNKLSQGDALALVLLFGAMFVVWLFLLVDACVNHRLSEWIADRWHSMRRSK